ncbi:hypothetical protein [Pelosinus sp. UFO1]|nr:hypothetical protein [Pelosinus sp. UFO1]AIF51219.1 hypothetical protein UFO1_1668 [Pelosinus sp. UFO1]
MIIDFDERKFKNEVRSQAIKNGASSSDADKLASMALAAVIKSSKSVKQ